MTRKIKRVKAPTTASRGDGAFAQVVEAFAGNRRVERASMFGSTGLRVRSKYFAMMFQGKLVVKLPQLRADALVESGHCDYFDPGHGRVMKQWVVVGAARLPWVALAKEAYAYVGRESG